ncbi:MAG TPA: tetratricopeptide repeat protein, partial [Nitrososphaeraceae archaeon]
MILPNKTISYFIKQGDYNFQTIRDFHTAIKWYEKALAIDKNNVEALSKKGEALSTLYNYSEAIELVDKALELEPNSVIA